MSNASGDLKLRQIEAFLAVAQTLSFTRAAERSGSTQPTVSHQIAELERRLGIQLFDRVGKSVRLTEAGTLFQGFAMRATKQIEDAFVALAELEGLARGTLRLGVIQSLSHTLLPPPLGEFLLLHPGVNVSVTELSARDIEAGLASGRFDLGIAFAPALQEETELEPILEEEMVLVVRKGHPLGEFSSISTARLTGVRMALLDSSYSTRRLIDRYFEEAGARPEIAFTTSAMSVMLAIAEESDLATIVPWSGFIPDQHPTLRTIRLTDPTPTRTSALLWPRHTFRRAAARAFVALLRKRFATDRLEESR